jgi:nucleoid-associated protein YgaU
VAQPLQPAERRFGHGLTLDLLQYDAKGRLSLAGRAPPGAKGDVYLNDRIAGHATATGEGKWTTTLEQAVPVGPYHLRLDALGTNGKRVAELDIPLERVSPGVLATSGTFVTVQPGNSLWRIARRTYGHGTRYVEIYHANTERISDPDLIYPGEVLAVPPASHAAPSTAAATSSSR